MVLSENIVIFGSELRRIWDEECESIIKILSNSDFLKYKESNSFPERK
jgi:hypothetical protein